MITGFVTEDLHKLVFQHNKLARAPMALTNVEARIFALALACLHQDSPDLHVKVHIKDVVKGRNEGAYERVRDGCKVLSRNPIEVETTDKDGQRTFITTPLFAELELSEKSGLLLGEFNEKLRSHLLDLKREFTKVDVETLLTLKSAYAHKLYWILKSWERPSGTIKIERQELRDMLQGQEQPQSYEKWTDFKRFVLEPGLKELHGLNWNISYEEKRVGRTVTSVTFMIPLEKPERMDMPVMKAGKLSFEEIEQYELSLKSRGSDLVRHYRRMQHDFKLTEAQARKVCDAIATEQQYKAVMKVLYDAGIAIRDNKSILKPGGYTMDKIKEVLPHLYSGEYTLAIPA